MKLATTIFLFAGTLLASTPALAATDFLLELDGVKGEAKATPSSVPVESWSFGVCNSGQCTTVASPRDVASGQATGKTAGKGRPSAASWDLATNKGARAAGGVNVAAGDLDGDGLADFAYVDSQSEVSSLSMTYAAGNPFLARLCMGKHIAKAVLRSATDSYELTDLTISCAPSADSNVGGITAGAVAGRQTQASTLGEKVQSGLAGSGSVTMTITGGQMKHTKTGHVTLLK
ncbi:MAG: hypothetical protein ACKOPM_15025 [Novosphingobium sp.]